MSKSEETVTISQEEYLNLLLAQRWLNCLEDAGVDNWGGYYEAVKLYQKETRDDD